VHEANLVLALPSRARPSRRTYLRGIRNWQSWAERRLAGIGSGQAGLKECQKLGFGAFVVLGRTEYYRRFGIGCRCQCWILLVESGFPSSFFDCERVKKLV